jgi:WD40 repeat protein
MTTTATGTDHPDPPAGVPAPSYTYDAFLSYSRHDAAVAEGIQKGLHRIARRPGRLHALRVFRDKTDLAASSSLLGRITDALDRSRYLIVVLSPAAAASEWVNKEVEYWLQHRGPDNLLLVVAAGQLDWDDAEARFDPDRSDAAVPALTEPGDLPFEPIFVDVSADAPWDFADPRFRDKVTDLAAPIHGKTKYELGSDDVREQRRFRRLRAAALVGLVLLTVMAVVAAGVAIVQRRAALQQRNDAIAVRTAQEARSILAGDLPGGEVRGVQQMLAAYALAPKLVESLTFEAVIQRQTMRKIVDTNRREETSLAISPDGRHIVTSASNDTSARLWDAVTGRPVGDLPLGPGEHSFAFSADGQRVVSAGSGGHSVAQVWDVQTGRAAGHPMTDCTDGLWDAAFSPHGDRVVGGCDGGKVWVWEVGTGRPAYHPMSQGSRVVRRVMFSPQGDLIASTADYEGAIESAEDIRLWNAATGQAVGKPIELPHGVHGVGLAFAPNGQRIVSGHTDGTVRVWDVGTGQLVFPPLQGHTDNVLSVAVSPDGHRIISGDESGTIRVWDAHRGQPIGQPISRPGEAVWQLGFTSNDQFRSGTDNGIVRVWDTTNSLPVDDAGGFVYGAAWSPDGQRFVTGDDKGWVRVKDRMSSQQIGSPKERHTGDVLAVAFSPDGKRVVSGGRDRIVRLWDAATGQPVGHPFMNAPAGSISGVAFSPDGKSVVVASGDGELRVWDLSLGRVVGTTMTGHTDWVKAVAVSPDGRHIVSGGNDHTVRLWDPTSGKQVGPSMTGHTDWVDTVAFSPDGRLIVSGGHDNTVRLWDATTGKAVGDPLASESGGLGDLSSVHSVAFSPDGQYIVAGDARGTIRIWVVATRKLLGQPITQQDDNSLAVAFSNDDTRIVSFGDRSTTAWPGPARWRDALCSKIIANMSRKHWDEWVSPDIDYIKVCPDLPVASD